MAQSVLSSVLPTFAPTPSDAISATRPSRVSRLLGAIDLNLAPWRYQKVLKQDGGPIDHLVEGSFTTRFGAFFRFDAFLLDHLRPATARREADGAGASPQRQTAQFSAVSEALESWAFSDRSTSPLRDLYGFDLEPSTHGMAAFPGLFAARARQAARLEGIERYAQLHWWEGRLRHELHRGAPGEDDLIEILLPDAAAVVVIAFFDDPATGLRTYGTASAPSLPEAVRAARLARLRHARQLEHLTENHLAPAYALLSLKDTRDRRALYFALEDGQSLFDERLRCGPWATRRAPRAIFDGLMPGDWDRYAAVWRCLYEPPSDEYAGSRCDYFLW